MAALFRSCSVTSVQFRGYIIPDALAEDELRVMVANGCHDYPRHHQGNWKHDAVLLRGLK